MIKVNYDKDTGKVIGFDLDKTPYIEITEEERHQPLPDRYSYYAVKDGKFIIERTTPTAEQLAADKKAELRRELGSIQSWFAVNDWKVNKIVIGEWKETDPRWQEYLTERQIKRNRQDAINAELEAK